MVYNGRFHCNNKVMSKIKIAVGLSGGVDSAVTALILKNEGYDVHAFYMVNWHDDANLCRNDSDYKDAMVIADQLEIPFQVLDFSAEYRASVFSRMIDGYSNGKVPNPDIFCNQYVKFKVFYETVRRLGFDYLATGHYANIVNGRLFRANDHTKDQTYFLCGIDPKKLSYLKFPLGQLTKKEVRFIAERNQLVVADKKDSVGVCFVGPKSFKTFLRSYIITKPGDILLDNGKVVGQHDGVIFYTLGQRQGIAVGGIKGYEDKPWYIVQKQLENNILVISQNPQHPLLCVRRIKCQSINWIRHIPQPREIQCVIRHNGIAYDARLDCQEENTIWITLNEPIYGVSIGQWCVWYDNNECLGGGEICETNAS